MIVNTSGLLNWPWKADELVKWNKLPMQSTGPDRVLTGRDGLVWRPKQKQLKQIAFVQACTDFFAVLQFSSQFYHPKRSPKNPLYFQLLVSRRPHYLSFSIYPSVACHFVNQFAPKRWVLAWKSLFVLPLVVYSTNWIWWRDMRRRKRHFCDISLSFLGSTLRSNVQNSFCIALQIQLDSHQKTLSFVTSTLERWVLQNVWAIIPKGVVRQCKNEDILSRFAHSWFNCTDRLTFFCFTEFLIHQQSGLWILKIMKNWKILFKTF